MATLTLDTGALIAANRGDRRFWTMWRAVLDVDKRIPAPVLAQAWSGSENARMSSVIASCFVVPMDEEIARRVGELCGRTRTSDVVDATVAVVASRFGDDVVTGDPTDIERLLRELGASGTVHRL